MKKIIRLTESDLTQIVRRIIKESSELSEIGDYDMNIITNNMGKVIESVNHNGYELSLVKFPMGKSISLTYNNKGYFKPNEQMKQSMEYSGRDILKIFRGLKPHIIEWVNKYGKLHVGSINKRRVDYYYNWLCDDLKCGDINKGPGMNKGETQYFFTINNI